MAWACSAYGRGEAYLGFWWGNITLMRPAGRAKRRRGSNIKIIRGVG